MNLENIVADLEYCKNLDPKVWGETVFMSDGNDIFLRMSIQQSWEKPFIPRPTFAEVWAKLPECKVTDDGAAYLQIKKRDGFYYPSYFWADGMDYGDTFEYGFEIKDPNPVNAAIKLYKWCEEEGYV